MARWLPSQRLREPKGYPVLQEDHFQGHALLFGVYAFWNVVAGQMGIFMPRVYAPAGVESTTEQNLLQILPWGCTVASTYFAS